MDLNAGTEVCRLVEGLKLRVGDHNLYIIEFLDCRAVQVVVNYVA